MLQPVKEEKCTCGKDEHFKGNLSSTIPHLEGCPKLVSPPTWEETEMREKFYKEIWENDLKGHVTTSHAEIADWWIERMKAVREEAFMQGAVNESLSHKNHYELGRSAALEEVREMLAKRWYSLCSMHYNRSPNCTTCSQGSFGEREVIFASLQSLKDRK